VILRVKNINEVEILTVKNINEVENKKGVARV
jgi:hypothetical protein